MRALEVTDLVKEFPTGYGLPPNRVIEDISFEMDMGDRMAIIGPNGCGKTTLLKTLATIYLPDSGSIKLFSQDMIKNPLRARKTFSFVSPSLNFQSKLENYKAPKYNKLKRIKESKRSVCLAGPFWRI